MSSTHAGGVLLLLGLAAGPAAAQQQTYGRPAGPDCETGAITNIFIDNHSIFDVDDPDLDRRFAWAYELANALHVRTKRGVIRRELLFAPGDCFDPALADESERLLRNLPFIGRVDVFGVAQQDGSYHVVVDTQDEWSTRVDVRVRFEGGLSIGGAEVREENLLGTGQLVRLYYFEHEAAQEYGVAYATPQLLATRWDLMAAAGQTRAGTFFREELAFPFVGEVGRWAAQQRFEREDRYFDFVVPDGGAARGHLLVPLRDKAFEIAVLSRVGPPGNLTVLGGGLAYQELAYPGGLDAFRFTHGDFDELEPADSALALPVQSELTEVRNIRALLLLGQRNIWWMQRRGFDSMRGVQDIPLGAEVQLGLGRSIPALQHEDDLFGSLTVYTALESGDVLAALRARADARRDFDAPTGRSEWEDVFVDGELLGYWKPGGSRYVTLLLRAEAVGGWHPRTPFQLTLGGDQGLRGYDEHAFPGARRVTASLEHRTYFGWPFADVLDLGGTLFADVGRMWAGDAPFGMDTGWRASIGAGLRGSFPAGARTTYRLDVAFPVDGGVLWGEPRLVISIGELLGLAAPFGDPRMLRSRRGGMFTDVFRARQ